MPLKRIQKRIRGDQPPVIYKDILLRLPGPLLEALDQAAGDAAVTRSELMRRAIEAFVTQVQGRPPSDGFTRDHRVTGGLPPWGLKRGTHE